MLPCTLLSLPSGEVWIEICYQTAGIRPGSRHFPQGKCGLKSEQDLSIFLEKIVTSLRGSVDWNADEGKTARKELSHFPQGKCGLKYVIKLPESDRDPVTSLRGSVDWNLPVFIGSKPFAGHFPQGKCGLKSWIRRNSGRPTWSLPSGEVWIEITALRISATGIYVTSLRGSVDWNWSALFAAAVWPGHFPQGKCGLKYAASLLQYPRLKSLPSGEVWIEILKSPAIQVRY